MIPTSRSTAAQIVAQIVAIDGIDGSGKSRFAEALAAGCAAQGLATELVRIDDYRRPAELERVEPDREADLYYERYYDFAAVDARVGALLAGESGAAALILVEGVFALRARLPAGTPLIVLEVDLDEARRRIMARDRAKGREEAEIARRIDRRYFPAQLRYRAAFDPAARADLLIDNGDWTRPRLLRRAAGRFPGAVERAIDRLFVTAPARHGDR